MAAADGNIRGSSPFPGKEQAGEIPVAHGIQHGGAETQHHRIRTVLQIDPGDPIGIRQLSNATVIIIGDDEHPIG